jgi:replicative DNA helicase
MTGDSYYDLPFDAGPVEWIPEHGLGSHPDPDSESASCVNCTTTVDVNPDTRLCPECSASPLGIRVAAAELLRRDLGESYADGAAPALSSRVGDVDGATFALDAPKTIPAIWGHRTEVIWAEGEPTVIYAPDGVGKTTIAQQLMLRRIGIGQPELLGLPVAAIPDGKKILYLALDRPRQASRSLRRMVSEDDRGMLFERLAVWRGSVPFDIVRNPGSLAAFALERNAGAVVIDSVKDIAANLSDEETGMAIHRAWQLCIEAEVEVLALHHPRKAQPGNKRPTALSDVYGSRWITAGCGSVILVWGEAGDPVVEFVHLKQPADTVGPFKLLHNNQAGAVEVTDRDPDPIDLVVGWVGPAPTVREVAAKVLLKPPGDVKPNEKEKVRRRLNIGVSDGRLTTDDIEVDGRREVIYFVTQGTAR